MTDPSHGLPVISPGGFGPVLRALVLAGAVAAAVGCGKGGPDPAVAARAVALENEGIAHLERYDAGKAQGPLREALKLAPGWVDGRVHLAMALTHIGPQTRPEARALLDGVLKEEPEHPRALFLAGLLAADAGEEASIPLLRRAYEITGDPVIGAKLGTQLKSYDHTDEALRVLEEVHAAHPALIAPVYSLQLLHRQLGNDEAAKGYFDRLRALKEKLNPAVDQSAVGVEMKDAYGNMGPYSMAVRNFEPGWNRPERPGGEVRARAAPLSDWVAGALPAGVPFLGAAVFDFDSDGDLDLFVCGGDRPSALLRNDGGMSFTDVAAEAGVAVSGAYTVVAGELDVGASPRPVDDPEMRPRVDLLVAHREGLTLLLNQGDGTFKDATSDSGLDVDPGSARSLFLLDADHEGDLDIFVSAGAGHPNRLYANRGPGTFVAVEDAGGLAGDGLGYGPVVAIDVDRDLDLDLVLTRPDGPPQVFLNDRMLRFHRLDAPVLGDLDCVYGGVGGDFDRDGWEDVVLFSDASATLLRSTSNGLRAQLLPGAPGGPAVDLDMRLNGLRDLVFADGTRLPGADGPSPFGEAAKLVTGAFEGNVLAADLDGEGAEEVIRVRPGEPVGVVRFDVADQGNRLVLDFEGVIRNDMQAGWSNLEGRGALVEVKAGVFWQQRRVGGPAGFGGAAPTRTVFGIGNRPSADFVRILWPDGVQQGVLDVPMGAPHKIVQEQRRPDSCPLLFSWDGEAFRFVTDFIGAGGVGFLAAPGIYGTPDPTESVKIPAGLVAPTEDGELRFRFAEAMEETCYLDRCDLLVVDHPADVSVYPFERFTGEPPFSDGRLLAHDREILPEAAVDGRGNDVLDRVLLVDRRYAGEAKLHPRLMGAVDDSVVELDFGDRLRDVPPGAPLVLYLNGWIEYGYTRTSVAAAGEGFEFRMPSLEAWVPAETVKGKSAGEGSWRILQANMGFPAGFPRVMTVDVTGQVSRETPRLRIRTNLEIYWDRIWLAPKSDVDVLRTTVLPLKSAELRVLGYPREFSPDGRHPRIYDYQTLDRTMPWKTVEGDYTRFGDVRPLLTEADDMYVVHGKGEEIDARFDGSSLPELPDGWTRSYVLRFTGWCKGQELYTAHGFTVEPLPFLGMTKYPYGEDEHFPDDEAHLRYRAEWNTRRIRSRRSD